MHKDHDNDDVPANELCYVTAKEGIMYYDETRFPIDSCLTMQDDMVILEANRKQGHILRVLDNLGGPLSSPHRNLEPRR